MRSFERAVEYSQQALQIDPNDSYSFQALGEARAMQAKWMVTSKGSPESYFQSANENLEKAIELWPEFTEAIRTFAEMYRWKAEWHLQRNESAKEDIRQGLDAVERSLKIFSESAEGHAKKGLLLLLRARSESLLKKRLEAARRAKTSLEEAFRINANLKGKYASYLGQAQEILKSSVR